MAFKMGYNFEGIAQLKPEQNLSGSSSRKLSRDMLIQKMHEERRKRQEQRLKLKSVQILQATVRSFIHRKHEKQNQRNDYLKLKHTLSIQQKLSRLLFFYDPNIDKIELYDLANDMLTNDNSVTQSINIDVRFVWLIKRFLVICMKTLDHENGPDLMLRAISTFSHTCDLILYLIEKGFFFYLRKFLDETNYTIPVFLIIHKALSLLNIIDQSKQNIILKSFCDNILKPPLTELIKTYFLSTLSKEFTQFYYDKIIEYLNGNDFCDYDCCNMFYSLLLLEPMDYEPNCASVHVFATLTKDLHKMRASEHLSNIDTNDWDNIDNYPIVCNNPYSIASDYIHILNNPCKVEKLIHFFNANCENEYVLNDFINICYNLLLVYDDSVKKHLLLYRLGINKLFLKKLWLKIYQSDQKNFQISLFFLSKLEIQYGHKILSLFCNMFTFYTETLTEKENSDTSDTFNINDFQEMAKLLKNVTMSLIEIAFPINKAVLNFPTPFEVLLLYNSCINCLKTLYVLDMRINFYHPSFWVTISIPISLTDIGKKDYLSKTMKPFSITCFTEDEDRSLPPLSIVERRSLAIIQELPFLIQFYKRFILLRVLCKYSLGDNEFDRIHDDFIGDNTVIIRRNYLYEDAFEKLSTKNDLKHRLRIQFIDNMGINEVGIDGGGIFKEFLNEVLRTAFDPNRGFFLLTADNMLYPNPNVEAIMRNYTEHYKFIGRLVGKPQFQALFENILVDIPLAEFFLNKLLVDNISTCHLKSLDPEIHKNLLYLRDYKGDVSELGLDFSTVSNGFGETTIIDLKPNGRNIQVTNANRLEYIQRLADLKLNIQLRKQCKAFKEGLNSVIPLNWLKIFSYKELQIILNGNNQDIDLGDLKIHTAYSGDFSSQHPTIILFWKILDTFTAVQQRQLLKFVTSCSRPPLLGFKELNPPFCIQSSGTDDNRMPTASTCLNLLKIPIIYDENILRGKLLAAIEQQAGFDLS